MRLTVQFQSGTRADALLLAVGENRARVVVAGRGMTEEWIVFDGHFYDEAGMPVQIDSMEEMVFEAAAEPLKVAGAAN